MAAGTIADPTKARADKLIVSPETIDTDLQAWLQNLTANTLIHSISQSRVNNGQDLVLVIAYSIP